MKCFFDTEFLDDGQSIDLISIGMVREDGEMLYLISSDFDESKATDWLRKNVLDHLGSVPRYPRSYFANKLRAFLSDVPKPEWWAYYGAYDFVVLGQLFGPLIEFPAGWPRYYNDLKVLANSLNVKLPPKPENEHHALADARWVRAAHDFCIEHKRHQK